MVNLKIKSLINSPEKKRLLENYFSLLFLQVANFILPLITLPYLVKVLGVEKFGVIMFAQSLIVFFNIFVDFGFNLSATREISIYRDNKEKLTEIFSSVMIIKLFLLLFSFLILLFLVFFVKKFSNEKLVFLLTYLFVLGQVLFPVWYFQGIEKMKFVTLINVIAKIIFTVLIFIFIHKSDDYIYVPLINGMGYIIGGIISLIILKKVFQQTFKIPSLNSILFYFKESLQYFFSRVSLSLYTASNTFVLGLFTNNIIVGYYSIADKLYYALQQLYQPIVRTLYPYITKTKNILLFKKVFFGFILLHLFLVILLFIIAPNIFVFLFSDKMSTQSIEVFNILLFASLVVIPSVFIGYPLLGAFGYAKYANLSVVIGSFVHIIGLILLVIFHKISIYSVAYMVLITEIVVFILRVFWVRNKLWRTNY